MILSGPTIIARQLVQGMRCIKQQQQPCGIDLTLRNISELTSAATIDFDNSNRKAARTRPLPLNQSDQSITLRPGAYLVDFNETVKIPLDCMASILPRSSLWRSGVGLRAGVVDAGYEGAMGALMEVSNPKGIVLYRDAKLAQIVFEQMDQAVEGYAGVYQKSTSCAGRDGMGSA
jgi:dUTP pyrophosphatase